MLITEAHMNHKISLVGSSIHTKCDSIRTSKALKYLCLLLILFVFIYIWSSSSANRYRITIEIDDNGELVTGSSVIQLKIGLNPGWLQFGSAGYSEVYGEAVVIDLDV